MVERAQAVAWGAGVVALAMAAGTPAVVEWAHPLHHLVRVPVVLAYMGAWAMLVAVASACIKETRLAAGHRHSVAGEKQERPGNVSKQPPPGG
ncbi:MAG TPA: hypothetical protein VIK73_11920 [Limnochordales bacterium]